MLTRLRCPHCGAPLTRNDPVPMLPPIKQHMFDTIKAAGEVGITSQELMTIIYHPGRRQPKIAVIRNHIGQINDLLAATSLQIVTQDRRHWIVIRKKRF